MEIKRPTSPAEDAELAVAAFYDEGYDGHIPTVAEEHLAYYSSGTPKDEVEDGSD